jgi:hypothetical protein
MLESVVALAILALVAAVAVVLAYVSWPTLLVSGALLVAIGFGLSLLASLLYHRALRRGLLRVGPLPARWWLSPTSHHQLLPPAERRRVLPYFYFGLAAFVVTMLGCGSLLLSALGSAGPTR